MQRFELLRGGAVADEREPDAVALVAETLHEGDEEADVLLGRNAPRVGQHELVGVAEGELLSRQSPSKRRSGLKTTGLA